jgi:hypothetical protein
LVFDSFYRDYVEEHYGRLLVANGPYGIMSQDPNYRYYIKTFRLKKKDSYFNLNLKQ